MKHIFIINPAAGPEKRLEKLEEQAAGLFSPGQWEVFYTEKEGDACRLARQAVEAGQPVRLYACGGDGTLNEVVNAAAGADHAAVTNVPTGTGNDFLRLFGREGRLRFRDLAALKDGPQTPFDLIDCGGILGLDVVCAGLDARVAAQVHRYKRLPLVGNKGAYILSLIVETSRGLCRPMQVDMGPIHHSGPTAILCVCNGRFYGGGFCPVPEAMPDDGVLDMLLIGQISFPTFLRCVGKYAKGRYRECPGLVQHYHGERVDISSPEGLVLVVDGEVVRGTSFTLRLSEKKVNFFYPADTSYLPQSPAHR